MIHPYALAACVAHYSRLARLGGLLTLLALLLANQAVRAQAYNFTSASSFNPDGIYGTSTGRATATTAAGDQYVTGDFTGTIVLGSTTLVSAGGNDVFVAKRSGSTGAWLWAVRAGGTGNDIGYGIAADAGGNALVTGTFQGTATFATAPAATNLVSAGGNDVFVAKFAAADGAGAWAVQAGGTGTDVGQGIAADAGGNALVTGSFQGTATFATAPAATSLVSAGNQDVFVAKFAAANGAGAWAVQAGGTGTDIGYGIAADAGGNALVTGYFNGTATFATAPAATSLVSAGGNDVFVAKFAAANGAGAWAVRAGGTGTDIGYGIAADAGGNALVTGYFNGTATFATAPAATSLVSAGGNDVFVAKFAAADGAGAWAVRAGGTGADIGQGIAADASGNALVTGFFQGTATFATAPAATTLVSAGGSDVFVAKFAAADGAGAWAVKAGGTGTDIGYGIAADAGGNALVTGSFTGTASFAAVGDAVAPGNGLFAARLAGSTGTWQAPAQANSGGTSTSRATATNAAGDQYVTGEFTGTIVLGSTTLVSAGSNDVFVAKRSGSTGAWLWAVKAGGTGNDYGYGVAADAGGNALVTGYFQGTATFATTPAATSLVSAGGNDVFVAKFAAANGAGAWAVQAGGTGNDVGYGIAADAGGNALVTGYFSGTATFATAPAATSLVSAGIQDVFVAKFAAADGAGAWAVRAGGTGNDVGQGIAADAGGNALVTGFFAGTATFATAPAATSLVSAGGTDVFVAKFAAADGAGAWAVQAGGTGNDIGNGIAADAGGNALVTGYFIGTATFATAPAATSLVSAGSNDVFVAKFAAANGAGAWAVQAGGTGADIGFGIAADAGGNALVTGSFNGTASFATAPAATSLVSAGIQDVFVAKFAAADGAGAWAVQAGGTGTDIGQGIAADAGGNALVTGYFTSTASFGNASLVGGAGIATAFVGRVSLVPVPAISSFNPTSGPVGTRVTITGTNLAGASSVSFNGTVQTTFVSNSATEIVLVVPAGATTGTLTVTTAGGTSAASSQPFTVTNPPTLTAVAPAPGGLGQRITLTGTNLSSPTALTINGANALAGIISNSGTSLVVRVPVTAAPTGNVSISNADGTATAPFTVMAPPGNALAFDGVDDHVVLPGGLNTASFTFEAWVNYQDNGDWTRIFDFGTTTDNWMLLGPKAGVGYTPASVGNIFFSLKKAGVSDQTIFTATPLPTGRWQHLAVTLATAGGTTSGTIYLNGVAIGTNPAMTLDPTVLGTLTYSWLGRSPNGDPYLKASLDEVRIWNTARTAAEVRADMAAPATAPFPAALRFYLNLDQGTPATASTGDNTGLTTLYDLVSAAPATLTGFALASGNTTSNYVESYAMVVPTATTSTARTATGFTVNWTAPAIGTATSYLLDVSTTADFLSPIAGSPFATTATSYVLTGLNAGSAYYYRVRALNSALAQPDQGGFSNTVSQTSPLPVELAAFTATASGNAVRLAWATASEKNSQAFEVERSLSGTSFERIGSVAAAGSSSSARSYRFVDNQVPKTLSPQDLIYYRLRQVDADGSFSYSPIRSVRLGAATEGLALYPNPTHGGTATLTGTTPGMVVQVFDALGRPVASATADAAGTATLALPAGLPTGVYVVRAGTQARRLTVE